MIQLKAGHQSGPDHASESQTVCKQAELMRCFHVTGIIRGIYVCIYIYILGFRG